MPPAGLPCVFPSVKKHAVAGRKIFSFNGAGRIVPHHGAKPPNWQGSLVWVFPLFPSRFWDPRPGLSSPLPGQRPAFLRGIGVHRGSSLAALRRLGPNRCRMTSPSPAPLPCASLGRGNPGWEAPACVSAAPFSPPMQIPKPAPAPAQRSPSVCLINFTVALERPRLRLPAGVRRRLGPVGEFSWILLRDFGCPSSGTGFSRHEVDSALWMRNAGELPCLLQKPPRGKKKTCFKKKTSPSCRYGCRRWPLAPRSSGILQLAVKPCSTSSAALCPDQKPYPCTTPRAKRTRGKWGRNEIYIVLLLSGKGLIRRSGLAASAPLPPEENPWVSLSSGPVGAGLGCRDARRWLGLRSAAATRHVSSPASVSPSVSAAKSEEQ